MKAAGLITGIVGLLAFAAAARGAEITIVSSVGVRSAVQELAPQFERESGHKVNLKFGTAVPLKRQIDAGDTFDVVILTPALVEDLGKAGKVAAGTQTNTAKVGIGMAVRAGTPKPDISTAEKLKSALLNAKSIVYSKEGQSGTYMAALVDRLGIAEQMKAKTVLETRSGQTAVAVVEGKADLGFTLISEILPVSGAEFAAPLPAETQNYVVFTAAVASGSKEAAAARAFIEFLKAPGAVPVLKAKGMEPG